MENSALTFPTESQIQFAPHSKNEFPSQNVPRVDF